MFTFYVMIFVSIIMVKKSYNYYKRIWNPICVLYLSMLFAQLSAIILYKDELSEIYDSIGWTTVGSILFGICFFFTQKIVNRKKIDIDNKVEINLRLLNTMTNICVILSLIIFALAYYEVTKAIGSVKLIFIHSFPARTIYLQRKSSVFLSLLGVFLSLNFYFFYSAISIAVEKKMKRARLKLLVVLGIRLISGVITMSKMQFIIDLVFIITCLVQNQNSKKEERKFVKTYGKYFIVLFLLLITVTALQRNYIGLRYSTLSETITGSILSYTADPIYGFGKILDMENFQFQYGKECFRPLFNILSYFGIGENLAIIKDTVAGTSINVFTMYGNMYRDFGRAGIVFLSVIIAVLLGCVYRTDYQNKVSNLTINAIVVTTLLMGFYNFTLAKTVYIFIILYAWLFEQFLYKKLYGNQRTRRVSFVISSKY